MVSIKIILDKRRQKENGTYPLNYQVYYNRKTRTRYSGFSIREDDWDAKNQVIRKQHNNYKLLNSKLQKGLAELQTELILADSNHVEAFLNPKQKQIAVQQETKPTLYDFADKLILDLKEKNQIGNAWVYQSTINALKGFHPANDIYFEQLDYSFLEAYNKYLVKKQMKHNSVYLYLRTLRIFYNKAIKLKIVDRSLYPFNDFKLAPEKTRKRAIDQKLMKKIKNLELTEGSTIWHVQQWFLLSFYLIGISVVDLALLTGENLKSGRILYKRKKTGKLYDISVTKEAFSILNYYRNIAPPGGKYLVPIINIASTEDEKLLRNVKDRTKLLNKYLKRIAELIKYDGVISTYTARHTWATTAKRLGFSNELIAEALGHEYGNETTAIYLDKFEQSVIDQMNEKVIKAIK